MADEDKAKAEKLAAAKKRVEALKKKKQTGSAAGASGKKEKGAKKDKAASDAKAVEDEEAEEPAADDDKEEAEEEHKESKESKDEAADTTEKAEKTDAAAGKSDKKKKKNKKGKKDDKDDEKEKEEKEDKEDKADADEEKDKAEAKDEANKDEKDDEKDEEDDVVGEPASPKTAAPSLSEQSRLRSASFRQGGPLSPSADGETAADIYRKQASRIDELERQNKRLTKENADAEKRWQKAEDALADTRDGSNGDSSEVSKLKSEIAALTRQNTQLSARSNTRHGSSPSMSVSSPPASELETQLRSKSQTIETMELELSRLRAQVERLSLGGTGGDNDGGDDDDKEGGDNGHASKHGRQEQVAALEEKLERAEKAAGTAQRELTELKRNLDRTSEKAVREGSARTSAETKLKTLEKEGEDLRAERDELTKKVEGLEKKVTTLTTLHKEHDARTQALRRDKEKVDKDLAEARTRLERVEAENLRLRKTDARDGGGTDDEHLDELLASSPEASERIEQLDRRVRELEAENTDLRSGIWHERRKELQVGPDDTPGGAGSRHFSDVDLSPMAGGAGGKKGHTGSVSGGGALGDFFSVLTGGGGGGDHSHHGHGHAHGEDDGLLDDDDDIEFDEEAFRRAHEKEARQRLERVREAKRALKNWEGWRLDLVESRQGGAEGIGPIFEI